MLNYYKSKTNYSDPRVTFTNAFLAHPQTHSEVPISMICPAGNTMGYFFGAFIVIKELALYINNLSMSNNNTLSTEKLMFKYELKAITFPILFMGIAMSMMNLNALLYLTPVFIIETIKLFI